MHEITAGDSETGLWCPVCQLDTRARVPLLLDGQPAGNLELCPGCGTGNAAVTRPPQVPESPPELRLPARLAAALRGLRRPSRPACAWLHCSRRSRCVVYGVEGDEGLTTYHFCSKRDRRYWCAYYGLTLP